MTASTPLSVTFPASLIGWEYTLTKALLRSDGGNATTVRSFEITPESLAGFCGFGPAHARAAERAFRQALKAEPLLCARLQHGACPPADSEVPNCMAILALTLLVDSLIDGDYEDTGAFREKLSQWLEIDQSFMDLRGIARMWEDLVLWLDGRVDAGAPFRRLVLPDIPPTWTHIGYTRYLSFPTRRDLRFLKKHIERDFRVVHNPAALIRLLDPAVRTSSISFGLKGAFEEFRKLLRSGGASTEHRFWRLVVRAQVPTGHREPSLVDFRMEFDEDGNRHFSLKSDDGTDALLLPDVGTGVEKYALVNSPNLGPAVRRGILFFRPCGLASWTAFAERPSGVRHFHFAVLDKYCKLASGMLTRFQQSGSWHITTIPVTVATIADFLNRLGISDENDSVRTISLVDGVHVGTSWLGQPEFLPHLEGSTGAVEIASASRANAPPEVAYVDGDLVARVPVDGDLVITDSVAGWSRHVSFTSLAEVHTWSDCANDALPVVEEWCGGRKAKPASIALQRTEWEERPYLLQSMIEALYASSRSGIGEGDAIALIGRAIDGRSWEVLRTLQESTFYNAHLRPRWRGHVLTLVQPMLTEVRSNDLHFVVASGAIPARLENDFRKTVELNGGQPFRRIWERSLAPPLLGAFNVGAQTLATALGWSVTASLTQLDGRPSFRLSESSLRGDHYQPTSAWDWSARGFRRGLRATGPNTLVRLVHPTGRDHDVYRVCGTQQRTFTSRYSAIIDLYTQACVPLFRWEHGKLVRLANDGSVPLEIARALRLRELLNGGATLDGWEYSASPQSVRWLQGLFHEIVLGENPTKQPDEKRMHLRGRGARRAVWVDGRIAT